jgi:predicted lipoprotein with Yx(FWY)xxD motif
MEEAMRILLALCVGLLGTSALAQTADSPLTVRTHAEEGTYIADGGGMSLYLFLADTQGKDGMDAKSACEGDCLGVWPALIVTDSPVGDDTLDERLLGTMERSDGSMQVTYNGWPLYYYAEDTAAGDIKGHDIESFGEEWYLLGPDGNRAEGGGGGGDDDDPDDDNDDSSGSNSGGNSGPGGGGDDDDDDD